MSKISELSDGGSLVSSDYLIAVRSGGNVKVRMDQINVDQIDLGDNEFIRLGNSQDLTIVHNASNSIINQAGIGDLLIQKAGSTKLTVNASGIDVTGSVTASGEVFIAEKLTHTGDTDTHFKFAGADDIRIVAGNVEHAAFDGTIVFNQSGSSTMDFRVESDTSEHMLFVDSSLNRVGIANNAPASALDVTGTVTADGVLSTNFAEIRSDTATLYLENAANTRYYSTKLSGTNPDLVTSYYDGTVVTERMRIDSAGNVGIGTSSPAVKLHVADGADSNAQIRINGSTSTVYSRLYSDNNGVLAIGTDGGNQAANSYMMFEVKGTERMRINASGNLLIGKNADDATTDGIQARGIGAISIARSSVAGDALLILNKKTNDGTIAEFRRDGTTTVGSIGSYNGADLYIGDGEAGVKFSNDNNNIIPWNTSANASRDNNTDLGGTSDRFRNLYLSGGAYLGGTGAANKLEDYEEGTFTPTITGSVSNPTVTYGTTIGKYTKVGNLVSVYVSVRTSNFSGGSGDLRISNLPFTSDGECGGGAPMFYKVNSFTETAPYIGPSVTHAIFIGRDNTDTSTAWAALQTSAWTAANPTLAQFQMTYFAS